MVGILDVPMSQSSRSMIIQRRFFLFIFVVLAVFWPVGCSDKTPEVKGPAYADTPDARQEPLYVLAVHPLYNPSALIKAYGPLTDYLSQNVQGAVHFKVEASRDYADFERKYRARGAPFILPNPWQCLDAMKVGYEVIAMAGEPDDFKGIFIVRKDSPIREVSDLKGKQVSYPSPTALAACMMPQWFLYSNGIDVNRDIENLYVGSQESSIMNAYLGQVAVGVTWPPPWRAFCRDNPDEAAQLKVIWETSPMVNNAVMVRSDVPVAIREEVRRLLINLHATPTGKAILAGMETDSFLPATDADYEPVHRFIGNFETEIRPVEKR
jgi:phosphonate transport system substrate-binding protein